MCCAGWACGKTTLAQALAEQAAQRGVQVFWVRPEDIAAAMLWVAVEVGAPPGEAARLTYADRARVAPVDQVVFDHLRQTGQLG